MWFWRSTRPVPATMAGLAALGSSRGADTRDHVAGVEGVAAVAPRVAVVDDVPVAAGATVPDEAPAWTRDPEPVAMPPSRPDFASTWAVVTEGGGDEAAGADVVTGPVPIVPHAPDARDARASPVSPLPPAPVVLDALEPLVPAGESPAAPPPASWAPPSGEVRPLADAVDGSPAPGDHG